MIISVKVGKYYAVNERAKAVKLRKTSVERLASREEVRAIKRKKSKKNCFCRNLLGATNFKFSHYGGNSLYHLLKKLGFQNKNTDT